MNKQFRNYYIAGLVSLLTFLIYLPSLQNEFVDWDDYIYIYANPFIRSIDASFFKWAFFDFYASNWHPLTWISHAADHAIWGLDPLGHHLTNNILHAVNTFLVVVLIMKMMEAAWHTGKNTRHADIPRMTVFIAAGVTGLLFGLHPIHVESVAWVSERKDLLCGLFFLLSLMMYQMFVFSSPPGRTSVSRFISRQYLMSIGFFLLALMSKPMAVSLPAVLLILDWYPYGRIRSFQSAWSAFVEKIPFISLALSSSIITVMAQKSGGSLVPMEDIALSTRILVSVKSLIQYIWKMILPDNLVPIYVYPSQVTPAAFEYLIPSLLVACITVACAVFARKNKVWMAVWGFYVVTLLPVLGVVRVGNQSMADRYTYLPGIGPFLIAGLFMAWVSAKAYRPPAWNRVVQSTGASVAIGLLVSLSFLTVKQIQVWENTVSLFTHAIDKSPTEYYLAYFIRGKAYREKGEYERALDDLSRSISLNPYYHQSYHNRAVVFEKMGRLDEAINDYTTSITTKPSADAYYGRGLAFSKQGEVDKAISDFKKVVDINPRDYEVHTMIGVLYGKSNSLREAIESFNNAVEANPDYHFTYGNRGHAYALIGDTEKALADFSKAIELDQNYLRAYVNRGNLYLEAGRSELAFTDFQRACDLGDKEACVKAQAVQNSRQTSDHDQ